MKLLIPGGGPGGYFDQMFKQVPGMDDLSIPNPGEEPLPHQEVFSTMGSSSGGGMMYSPFGMLLGPVMRELVIEGYRLEGDTLTEKTTKKVDGSQYENYSMTRDAPPPKEFTDPEKARQRQRYIDAGYITPAPPPPPADRLNIPQKQETIEAKSAELGTRPRPRALKPKQESVKTNKRSGNLSDFETGLNIG